MASLWWLGPASSLLTLFLLLLGSTLSLDTSGQGEIEGQLAFAKSNREAIVLSPTTLCLWVRVSDCDVMIVYEPCGSVWREGEGS